MAGNVSYDSKILKIMAEKLGFGSNMNKIIKKSDEYLRLLQLKSGGGRTGLINVNDTCRAVVCLDLAAANLCIPFDKAEAHMLAGVNKNIYRKTCHTIGKLLGLSKKLTISDLTVQLGCSEVSDVAQSIIDRYVCDQKEGKIKCQPVDLDHPMYYCAAVLAACKHRRVKVKKEVLQEICCVRASDLDKLAANLSKIAAEIDSKRRASRKRGHHLIDLVEEIVKESGTKNIFKKDEDEDVTEGESYDDWKKRILEEASSA